MTARFSGPLHTEGELLGRSHYVFGLNPGRRRSILGNLKEINWSNVLANAAARGLVHLRSKLQPRGQERPDLTVSPSTINLHTFESDTEIGESDPSVAPF